MTLTRTKQFKRTGILESRSQGILQNNRGCCFHATKRIFITSLQIYFKPKSTEHFLLQWSVIYVETRFWRTYTKII